jgi:hypothetical protein
MKADQRTDPGLGQHLHAPSRCERLVAFLCAFPWWQAAVIAAAFGYCAVRVAVALRGGAVWE